MQMTLFFSIFLFELTSKKVFDEREEETKIWTWILYEVLGKNVPTAFLYRSYVRFKANVIIIRSLL